MMPLEPSFLGILSKRPAPRPGQPTGPGGPPQSTQPGPVQGGGGVPEPGGGGPGGMIPHPFDPRVNPIPRRNIPRPPLSPGYGGSIFGEGGASLDNGLVRRT